MTTTTMTMRTTKAGKPRAPTLAATSQETLLATATARVRHTESNKRTHAATLADARWTTPTAASERDKLATECLRVRTAIAVAARDGDLSTPILQTVGLEIAEFERLASEEPAVADAYRDALRKRHRRVLTARANADAYAKAMNRDGTLNHKAVSANMAEARAKRPRQHRETMGRANTRYMLNSPRWHRLDWPRLAAAVASDLATATEGGAQCVQGEALVGEIAKRGGETLYWVMLAYRKRIEFRGALNGFDWPTGARARALRLAELDAKPQRRH